MPSSSTNMAARLALSPWAIFSRRIIGDYDDEYVHSNNETLTEVSDGHYLTTGACSIDDFAETVGFDSDDFPEYETLGGLLLESFDRIPDVGDETTYFEGQYHGAFHRALHGRPSHRPGRVLGKRRRA